MQVDRSKEPRKDVQTRSMSNPCQEARYSRQEVKLQRSSICMSGSQK